MSDASAIFSQIAADASARPKFSTSGTYGTPPAILDNLEQVESSGGKNNYNPQSGATGPYQFMPSTVASLKSQGVDFDPMNAEQSRAAADYYLSGLAQKNGGNYDKALAQYGGFVTKNPSAYVSKVTGGAQNVSSVPDYANTFDLIAGDASSAPSTPDAPKPKPDGIPMTLAKAVGGVLEVPTAIAGSLAGSAAGGLRGIYDVATGQGLNKAVQDIGATQGAVNKLTAPETPVGNALTGVASIPGEVVGNVANRAGQATSDATGSPLLGAAVNTGLQGAALLAGGKVLKPVGERIVGAAPEAGASTPGAIPPELAAPHGSIGAAASNYLTGAENVSPGLRASIESTQARGDPLNTSAVTAHIESESLPVPVRLTAGQASGDASVISKEQNERAAMPELAQHFAAQNEALKANLPEFREKIAPDVFDANQVEVGQGLIDAYKARDAQASADVDAKYQALRDANGGEFPVDGTALYDNIAGAFKKDLNSSKLTEGPIGAQMRELKALSDSGSMTMEQYLALRRNLGDIARTSSDGTDRAMASLAARKMEELPLQGGAADLKPLADAARQAARQRFKTIESDPAYKAAISGAAPDNFVSKYVVGAPVRDVDAMKQNLADDPLAAQRMGLGVFNFLRDRAGFQNSGQWNFRADAYNKALDKLGPKMGSVFDGDTGVGLQALGNTARRTTFQPRGAHVNNSNTFTANVKLHAGNLLTQAADGVVPHIPLGNIVRGALTNHARKAFVRDTLAPGAGINLLTGPPK